MNTITTATTMPGATYRRYLLAIAGMGGLLYGIDVGIFAAALLYVEKTVILTVSQTSILAAAVLGGGTLSSLIGGVLADWVGRRTMVIISGLLFVLSVGVIVLSQTFVPLLAGRLLQGISTGVIAVVVPLYLAECLAPEVRGRGSAIFQLMLTIGIVIAALVGLFYTSHAETAITLARGNTSLIRAAEDHAWRGMFLAVVYPGIIFFLGSFFLGETPRWLFRRGRREEALAQLERTSSLDSARLQLAEMEALAADDRHKSATGGTGSLLQRKYIVPFVLACVILACNQATGINSILGYLIVMLKHAGMDARHAAAGNVAVTVLNSIMTVVAVALVDRKGRKFLLVLGTSGIIVALAAAALLFRAIESNRLAPGETTGWLVAGCLAAFIAAFAVGPGVVVWLALSELMPTRIRSAGMGIALLLNQGVSTAIAGVFLPVVGRYGYAAMFAFWALCTVVYFITAAFFLPETKGRTLEEIEQHFEGAKP